MEKLRKDKIWNILLIVKYLFSVILTMYAFRTLDNWRYILVCLMELASMISISYWLIGKNKVLGQIVHFLLLLIYNIQIVVVYFGGTYVSFIMLSNIEMFQDLQGKFGAYILMAIPVFFLAFIPANSSLCSKITFKIPTVFMGTELVLLVLFGSTYSPICSLYHLYTDFDEYQNMNTIAKDTSYDALEFYSPEVEQYREKSDVLPEKPNVVLIFVEGLSENIINDERNIMPNLQKFQSEVLRFDNYYNHTCATYRGLIGQLYSGYQLNNTDSSNLTSLQSILQDKGYLTTFINVEPEDRKFTDYLGNFQFDELLTDKEMCNGDISIWDKDAYELLYETIEKQHRLKEPFFTSMYSYGTHATNDSPDEQYGDGSNPLLNKFYNADYQLGLFIEKFKKSEMFEDTVLIITTDHATYVDDDFLNTFPNYEREYYFLDEIPLFI